MKPVQIITDYCLFQFDPLKFSLGDRLHRRSVPNFNFFNVNPQIFTTFLTLVWELLDVGIITNASFSEESVFL